MKVTLLSDENILKDVQEEVNRIIEELDELYPEEDELKRTIKGEEQKPTNIEIDLTDLLKPTEFHFRSSDVAGVYISSLLYKRKQVMIIVLNNLEYPAIYDEKIYKELERQLNFGENHLN